MLDEAQVERVARWLAGDLPEAEAAQVSRLVETQAPWREARARLEALDALAARLPTELSPAQVESWVTRALPPRSFRWLGLVAAAAVLVALVGAAWLNGPQVTAVAGDVRWNGATLEPGQSRRARAGVLQTRHGAATISLWDGELRVPEGTSLTLSGRPSLNAGTVVVRDASLEAGGAVVTLQGVGVLSVEPLLSAIRDTSSLASMNEETLMTTGWLKLGAVGATTAVLGGAVTLSVVRGEAQVTPAPEAATVVVRAGDSWRGAPEGAPVLTKPTAAAPVAVAGAAQASPVAGPQAAVALASLSKEQLVTFAEKLRDENLVLQKQRDALQKQMKDLGLDGARNYYRQEPDELRAAAAKGELRLRGPQLGERLPKFGSDVIAEASLTPEEVEKLKAIYQASAARAHEALRGIYLEIGGAASTADSLSSQGLLQEIADKSPAGTLAVAVRAVTKLRAGLIAPGSPATQVPLARAYLVFVTEDDRVISEIEALLGPRRAEALLYGKSFDHMDHAYGVGPEATP